MNGELTQYRENLQKRKGQREEKLSSIEATKRKINLAKRQLRNAQDSQVIIQKVAKETQEELAFRISEPICLALESIFDDPYKFKIDYINRRGKTECDLLFEKNGQTLKPIQSGLTSTGGGPIDVASFALRVALWSLKRPKTRPTIILDEPLRFLSNDLQPKASELIKTVGEELGIQFIIVSHQQGIEAAADKVFNVTQDKKGVSHIEEK